METTKDNYYTVMTKIYNALGKFRRANNTIPKEVWLGPKQREAMAVKWMNDKIALSYLPNHFPFDETVESLIEKLKGSKINGLKIRFTEEDGVWVGISFEGENI